MTQAQVRVDVWTLSENDPSSPLTPKRSRLCRPNPRTTRPVWRAKPRSTLPLSESPLAPTYSSRRIPTFQVVCGTSFRLSPETERKECHATYRF
jgi:hypothetical protein